MYNQKKFVFVQLYNVMASNIVGYDPVDDMVGCIRVTFNRHGEREGKLERGNIFQLFPINYIRGRVYVITAHDMEVLLHNIVP